MCMETSTNNVAPEDRLARKWCHDMPEASVEIIAARRLAPGCTLVKLDSDITRPNTKD